MSSIEIPIGKNKFAIIDIEDLELVMRYKWRIQATNGSNLYAVKCGSIYQDQFWLHHYIANFYKHDSLVVDHINRNGLDNRKRNLRIATLSQNNSNRINASGNNKYRGVCKAGKKHLAFINVNNKRVEIGKFESEVEAAIAYDKKAIEIQGEFCVLNFKATFDVVFKEKTLN